MKTVCKLISDYMGVLVLLAAVLALLFPEVFSVLRPTIISPLLGVIMFGMGLTLNLEDFRIVFSRPRDVMIGCLAQFTIMPLLAWILAKTFSLDEALTVGVVLVGCCPGGTASNVITYLAKGDLALSVGMTGISTLLAPVLTPLLVWFMAGKSVDVDVMAMFLSILWVVILPIIVGACYSVSPSTLITCHRHDCDYRHFCQCQQTVGWRTHHRAGCHASQHLRIVHRLSDWPSAPHAF